ncbi:uroporphyrinogen-III C-methyltransferase [Bacillus sp. FJAT-50079]|uniref:uroporphyrinogen-III C-methyltransferase n=1 Tax=Bacillus sp. FJAT-50079 TaxID=2833577 RepID=UPI001BCA521F|nr:uroporphyrinogen-III C-methyltransferase [Bacillus sp. FJAT-50079]MBS4209466.1 uroporphyrinogen-III C-methyltransferase [Bacillus sp. FJAT-50079]
MTNNKGFVSIVGAGPGDLELITCKGLKCIEEADVILYDRLANPRLLREAKDECEFIYCGKLPSNHVMRQEMINAKLVELAKQGKYVVRLKGGDPSVFGRVGEEAEELVKNNIPYEWIPGITSSIAAAAYAGIPVTHRKYSNSFTMRTGHDCALNEGKEGAHQQVGDTIAYYMSVKNIGANCEKLIAQGKSKHTKVAMIQWGTLGKQKVIEGTLETMAQIAREHEIENPAMTIIGDVVSLRESLSWFETKPFYGKHILIARSQTGNFELERHFSDQGAEAYSFPLLKRKKKQLTDAEIKQILNSQSLMFASPESAELFLEQLLIEGIDIRDLPRKIVCRSNQTKKLLAAKGLVAEKGVEEAEMVVIAPYGYETKNGDANIFHTHEMVIDERFREINERMLTEYKWDTVIFPNKAAIDLFIKENVYTENELSFAYIGESVKEYALKKGFTTIDQKVQDELEREKWGKTNV